VTKSDTKERIFEAALAVFSEKGFAAATTRAVAERAGVNEVTLFRHFGSKENLLQEAIVRYSPLAMLTDTFDSELTGDPRQDLTHIAHTYIEKALERVDQIRIGIMEAPRNPELAKYTSEIPRRLTTHLASYFETLHAEGKIKNANFFMMAQMFYAVLFQSIFIVCSNYHPEIMDHVSQASRRTEYIDTLVNLFVSGLT
jgi:AcrR family transcriptional regulator